MKRSFNIIAPYPNSITLGPFEISFLPVSHSIPESSGLIIQYRALVKFFILETSSLIKHQF